MFSNNNKPNPKKSDMPAASVGVNSLVQGTTIKGEIKSPGNFRIDGKIDGNVIIEGRLIIGDKGHIVGDVKCRSAEIEGTFDGNIQVQEILSLRSTAKIYGDAVFGKLKVEEGAELSCSCNLNKGNRKTAPVADNKGFTEPVNK